MAIWSKTSVTNPLTGDTYNIRGHDNATQAMLQFDTNALNYRLAKEQNDWNEQMWNKQNEYNSPAHQLQLLAQAGINPNVYANQGATAQSIQSADMANQVAPSLTSNDAAIGDQILNGLSQGINLGDTAINALYKNQQMEEMRANIAESKQRQRLFNDTYSDLKERPRLENDKLATENSKIASEMGLNNQRAENLRQEKEIAAEAWQDTHKLNKATLQRMREELRGITADSNIKEFEAKFRKQFGIDPRADWPSMLIQLSLSDPGTFDRIINRIIDNAKSLVPRGSWFNPFD